MARKSKKRVAYLGFTGVAAGAGLAALAGGPAFAAPTAPAQPTLSARSGPSHTLYKGPVKGTNSTPAILSSSGGTILSCHAGKATASGNIPHSQFGLGPGAVTDLQATFTSCTLGDLRFDAMLSQPASFSVTGHSDSVTTGILRDIDAVITGAPFDNSCRATVTGSLSGSFRNATHTLLAGPNSSPKLTIDTASHCGGLTAGNHAFFQTTYKISTPTSLSITSA